MKESILPRMRTDTQDTVLGGIIKHVNDGKMVLVVGEPGEGKTTTVLDFCSQYSSNAYYYRCSTNTTMNGILVFMANALGIRIVGGNDELQARIEKKMKETTNCVFVFDEAEYIAHGSGLKLDTLRQIYDASSVPIIISGTYELKDIISGEKSESKKLNHNKPQIFRRLRKEEFERIEPAEIYKYLVELEKQYAVIFDKDVVKELVNLCRDRQNGGLGNFIEVIELLFSQVRPEWEIISNQIAKETGREFHDHTEASQIYTSIKLRTADIEAIEESEGLPRDTTPPPAKNDDATSIDVSKLKITRIDIRTYNDALRHKAVK